MFSVACGLPTTTLMVLKARTSQAEIARSKLNRHWARVDAYRFRPLNSDWLEDPLAHAPSFRLIDPGDPRALDSAHRALEDFGLFGPGDWHQSEAFRDLPHSERDDLELWLMEQAYRYGLALAERPDSRNDWERARNLLDHLGEAKSLPAFTALAARLNEKLQPSHVISTRADGFENQSDPQVPLVGRSALTWMSDYLLGVAAECEFEVSAPELHRPPSSVLRLNAETLRPRLRGRQSASKALGHYRNLLAIRPESYWGNYRTAGVYYSLGRFAESKQHLDRCLAIRPDNAAIRGQRAACLAWLERYCEALDECDQAVDRAPELPELYRTRAFIRAAAGQTGGLADDVQHFELLYRLMPTQALQGLRVAEPREPDISGARMLGRLTAHPTDVGLGGSVPISPRRFSSETQILSIDSAELSKRLVLASKIRDAGDHELASKEYTKILMLDANHVPTRALRAFESIERGCFDQAQEDLEVVLTHPHLTEYLSRKPTLLRSLLNASRRLSLSGRVQEGQSIGAKCSVLPTSCSSSEASRITTWRVPTLCRLETIHSSYVRPRSNFGGHLLLILFITSTISWIRRSTPCVRSLIGRFSVNPIPLTNIDA